ncbi:hypothetical protein QJS10_CPB11g01711 [Acorus calamus]|uniref:Terpene synthase N-terminal domain-containing protein n=1 Tax=Acorus calamus TaxID=4465 RepID=A0AAV9DW85_ACOCL|nr:hypothetical protein QJS10_CPB11g01711 [Acorus calamus]
MRKIFTERSVELVKLPKGSIDVSGEVHIEQAEKLKEEMRKLLNERLDPVAMLELIDNLQHLGIGYLFDKEINESL